MHWDWLLKPQTTDPKNFALFVRAFSATAGRPLLIRVVASYSVNTLLCNLQEGQRQRVLTQELPAAASERQDLHKVAKGLNLACVCDQWGLTAGGTYCRKRAAGHSKGRQLLHWPSIPCSAIFGLEGQRQRVLTQALPAAASERQDLHKVEKGLNLACVCNQWGLSTGRTGSCKRAAGRSKGRGLCLLSRLGAHSGTLSRRKRTRWADMGARVKEMPVFTTRRSEYRDPKLKTKPKARRSETLSQHKGGRARSILRGTRTEAQASSWRMWKINAVRECNVVSLKLG